MNNPQQYQSFSDAEALRIIRGESAELDNLRALNAKLLAACEALIYPKGEVDHLQNAIDLARSAIEMAKVETSNPVNRFVALDYY